MTTTKAIVLSALKYGDYDLIVKCYTEIGIKTFLLKRVFKSSKGKFSPAFFQLLTQLEITANYNPNKTLHFIKEVTINYPYTTISQDVSKQTIVVFLAEILTNALREEEENLKLFSYLEAALQWLDTHTQTANFHLLFLLNLTKHLGFYPKKEEEFMYFDLQNGKFENRKTSLHMLSGENLRHFKTLLGTNFDTIKTLKFNKRIRQDLLEILIEYFELHLHGFRKPKSLEVLKMVFS